MNSLFKFLAVSLLLQGCIEARSRSRLSEDETQKLLQDARTYSFMIRDHGLDPSETKALSEGAVQLGDLRQTWLASADHEKRMLRFFDDMMGFRDDMTVLQPNIRLNKTADGVYFSASKGSCTAAEAVSGSAWWLPDGEEARFCPNLMPTELSMTVDGTKIVCTKGGRQGFLHPACGCGPDRITCIAGEEANKLQAEVQSEFSARALGIYKNGSSWLDLLAAPEFYGTRRLYWLYFQNQSLNDPKLYTDEALKTIRSVPLNEAITRPYPVGAEHAGIATAPGFLVQYNNFRSRIAGLTRSFLCQDMNPTLNTDGIQTFVNPSLKPEDIAHGTKADCSSCHYALDNLGGAVMPWTDRGVYQPKVSSKAHAFGETGQGPAFLMQSYVERGPGFEDCMARRAWEDFSSQPWSATDETVKSTLRSWVAQGPKALIQTLISSKELASALSGDGGSGDDLSAEQWAQLQPIVQASCGGGSCHSRGSAQPSYADESRLWVADKEKIRDRLQRTTAGQMPPRIRPLSDTDRQLILRMIENGI